MKQIEVVAAIIRKAAIEQEQSDAGIDSAEREQARSEIKGDKIFATQRGVCRLQRLVGVSWWEDGGWGDARGGAEAGD